MASEIPKGVSSRLLTMKFMQRAAASSAAASSPATDSEDQTSKRRKLQHGAAAQTRFNAEIDQASIQAANDEREAKRQVALEKHATAADTHWVLRNNVKKDRAARMLRKPMRVVYVGYGNCDLSDEEGLDDPRAGRTSTKKPESTKSSVRRME